MRLVTYSVGPAGTARAGVRVGHRILDIESASRVKGEPLPSSVKALLAAGRGAMSRVQALAKAATSGAGPFSHALHEERAVRLLPPVPDADRFLRVGRDHRPQPDGRAGNAHSAEAAQEPAAFVKIGSRLVGQDAKVALPAGTARVDCEPELVFVIGRHALGVKKEDAMDYVAGVTILNDVPGFAPLGPEIVTMDEIADPYDLWMTCSVNGVERLRVNTRDQVGKLPDILEHYSRHGPLDPGDLFCAGATGGGAAGKAGLVLGPGDAIESSIEGVATLRTLVAAPGES